MHTRKQPTALFVADSHFHLQSDESEQLRVDAFVSFLEIAKQADHLFLLGDIFDFWFDYPHFRLRGYDKVLLGLDEVRDAGVRMHFVGGNHDIWATGYFRQRYGCEKTPDFSIVPLGDQRIRIGHGDGLLGYDWAYDNFRRIVRTRAGILLAKSLHPEILYAFSAWLSGKSRAATREETIEIEQKARTWLDANASADWDLMIIGHVHHGFDIHNGTGRLVALPGWLGPLGYGLLRDGRFSLREFPDDPFAD